MRLKASSFVYHRSKPRKQISCESFLLCSSCRAKAMVKSRMRLRSRLRLTLISEMIAPFSFQPLSIATTRLAMQLQPAEARYPATLERTIRGLSKSLLCYAQRERPKTRAKMRLWSLTCACGESTVDAGSWRATWATTRRRPGANLELLCYCRTTQPLRRFNPSCSDYSTLSLRYDCWFWCRYSAR